jgi:NADH:ubiquinone oxidoreductase subunit F (NADH-binding)/NADH:ubiquinone oxidoreductase subunit E
MINKTNAYKPIPPQIEELAVVYGKDPEFLLEILKKLQNMPGGLSSGNITEAARSLGIPPHKIYGMATFYSMLLPEPRSHVTRVCDGPVCWLKRVTDEGKAPVFHDGGSSMVTDWIAAMGDGDYIERASCLGLCDRAPAILVDDQQVGPAFPMDARRVREGWRGVPNDYSKPRHGELRVTLREAGNISPDSIDPALEHGAYEGLKAALAISPEDVISEVTISGLQGRGGAGFPTGAKWDFCRKAVGKPKYVICNADESEPLIFKDRVLIETNPHQVLEGMSICGYACGAKEAWIYIRGEYEYQALCLEHAIRQAEEKGYLGKKILGSDFSFKIHVHRGAGAYICGEETALIESLEGRRGEPRLRPPYPPTYGYRGRPTVVNNVETFAVVPHILKEGADWWRSLSEYSTPGVKLYMVLGHVRNPGLFEAPFGLTLRQIIDDFGGGMLPGSEFKCALAGGAAGTIVDSSLLDIPIDYASNKAGISLGAGAYLVCDQRVSVVALLLELMHFFSAESCGKCVPCRIGATRAFEILTGMASGKGQKGNIEELKALALNMLVASFCGLGQAVSIPIDTALKNFTAEFSQAENQTP